MLNPYVVLGVAEDCTKDELKKAYRKAAQLYHPDKNKRPDAAEKFRLVKEAYDFILTGKSSTGVFTAPRPAPSPKPNPWAAPPRPTYSIEKVKVSVKFSEIFGNARVQIPRTQFFVNVPVWTQHGDVKRLLCETINHSHQVYFDVEFEVSDPTGFHKITKMNGKDVLYSKIKVSSADALSGMVLYYRNINPNVSDVAVKITAKDKIIRIENVGLPDVNGRRGDWFIEPVIEFKPLEEERFDTLIALRDKLNETLKTYHNKSNNCYN